MKVNEFRELAFSLPGTEEAPHFQRTSFRVRKKIFVTLDEKSLIATFKFSEVDQSVFCLYDKKVVYPVPNKWGNNGWTYMDLRNAPKELIKDALNTSYQEVLKSKKKKD